MGRQLNGVLALHDVADTEHFCARILQRKGLDQHHDAEDILAWLIELTWELSLSYRPGGITFSTWAGTTLRRRLVDRIRTTEGRTVWKFSTHTYTRQRPVVVSIDEPSGHRNGEIYESTPNAGLHDTLRTRAVDDPADRATSLDGLLRTGHRPHPRAHAGSGQSTAREAA